MATTFLGPFKNQIRPVGEEIVLDLRNTSAIVAADVVALDFEIDQNMVLTDLIAVKTGAAGAGGTTFLIEVVKVENGPTATAVATAIMGSVLSGANPAVGTVLRPATTMLPSSTTGSTANRMVGATSQKAGVAGTTNSQQRVRLRITVNVANAAADQADFMVKMSFSRFSTPAVNRDEVLSLDLSAAV